MTLVLAAPPERLAVLFRGAEVVDDQPPLPGRDLNPFLARAGQRPRSGTPRRGAGRPGAGRCTSARRGPGRPPPGTRGTWARTPGRARAELRQARETSDG